MKKIAVNVKCIQGFQILSEMAREIRESLGPLVHDLGQLKAAEQGVDHRIVYYFCLILKYRKELGAIFARGICKRYHFGKE